MTLTRVRLGRLVGLVVLVLGIVLVGPVSSASAGPGEWDYVGTGYTTVALSTSKFRTDIVYSRGGYFKLCVNKTGYYMLNEYDPGDGNDDLAGQFYLNGEYPGWCDEIYIDPFVDGGNLFAEFYVSSSVYNAKVTFYD